MKAISTKYLPPTERRGARISADDGEGNRLIVSYDHSADNPFAEAAIQLCTKMGWNGEMIEGHIRTGRVYVFADGAKFCV